MKFKLFAAYVYVAVCVFDFVVMPLLVHNEIVEVQDVYTEVDNLHKEGKIDTVEVIDPSKMEEWKPLTLMGNGIFHLSFGGLIMGTAMNRIRNGKNQ